MRHSASTRILAAMIAVWFGFLTMQSPYASPCPHHQPALAELAMGMGHAVDMHAMHGMSHHGQSGQNDSAGDPCDCLGISCGTTTAAAFVQSSVIWIPEPTARTDYAAISHVVNTPKLPAFHTLPFATAPPAPLLV